MSILGGQFRSSKLTQMTLETHLLWISSITTSPLEWYVCLIKGTPSRLHNKISLSSFSCFIGRLDYCNSLLYKVPAVHMSKLQRIQNSAARLVCSTPRFNHITPVLFSLHWLPVAYRIEFKILVLTFKAIYQLAPSYICNLVRLKEKCKYQLRSSEELLLQLPMGKTKKTLGDRSFQIAAPSLWNSLPASVRDIDNFLVFKRTIKTYLFRKAFSCYS